MSKETTTPAILLRNLTDEQKGKVIFFAECFINEFNIEAFRSFLIHYAWQQVEAGEVASEAPFEVHAALSTFKKTLTGIVNPE